MNFSAITRPALRIAISAAAATLATSALAAPLNEGFESGLNTWTRLGDVSIRSAGPATPFQGSAYLLLSTASLGADDYPSAAGAYNFSGIAAATSASLEASIGASAGALDPDVDNFIFASEGSAASKSFAVSAGETLSFNWNFLSNESSAAFGDYAFVSLGGSIVRLADTSSSLATSSPFARQTGYRSFTATFATSGSLNIGFGVVDVNDGSVTSALAIDNLQIAAVPEPGIGMLMALGLGVLGALGKKGLRRRRQIL